MSEDNKLIPLPEEHGACAISSEWQIALELEASHGLKAVAMCASEIDTALEAGAETKAMIWIEVVHELTALLLNRAAEDKK